MIRRDCIVALLKALICLALTFVGGGAGAETRIANIFSDHMVLQRDIPIPIWGTSQPGTRVTVEFLGQTKSTQTDEQGHWRVRLEPVQSPVEGAPLEIRGGSEIVIRDVAVGEVWLASGQSNMQMRFGSCAEKIWEAKEMLRTADYPEIRFRRVDDPASPRREFDLESADPWVRCSPESAADFSAVAFVFALRLREELRVPIGIIDSSWGGKPIEPFIPRSSFSGHPTLEALGRLADVGDLVAVKALKGGTFARDDSWLAGRIFNGRIAPVVPFAARGAIWYQAESNCGVGEDPRDYEYKMRALIDGWRSEWGQERFPFYYVQLPSYTSDGWAIMRDQQRRAMSHSDCGMAVTHDLTADGIHPSNKIDVGERLALWPLANLYGKEVVYSGPLYRSHRIEGDRVLVSFDHTQGGLMMGRKNDLKPTQETPDAKLFGFELANQVGEWTAAKARIEDDTVVVQSPKVPNPVAVRYAIAPQPPEGGAWNLYNRAGLPASPFCSDKALLKWAPMESKSRLIPQ